MHARHVKKESNFVQSGWSSAATRAMKCDSRCVCGCVSEWVSVCVGMNMMTQAMNMSIMGNNINRLI